MSTLFTRIINGELPGHFVWRDDHCVAFMTIAPIRRGHVLVVPRLEVDHWIEAPEDVWQHAMGVAKTIGRAIQDVFAPSRVGLMVAGFEIPHLHIHVMPIDSMADMDFANADGSVAAEDLAHDASKLAAALTAGGHGPQA